MYLLAIEKKITINVERGRRGDLRATGKGRKRDETDESSE